jgi:hypothetical protein
MALSEMFMATSGKSLPGSRQPISMQAVHKIDSVLYLINEFIEGKKNTCKFNKMPQLLMRMYLS